MSDLATAFDCSTGIYSLYRWCKYFGVPKELYYVILELFKRLNSMYCSLGTRSRRAGAQDQPIGTIMRTYIEQIPMGVTGLDDYTVAGKIIFCALLHKETNNILHRVPYYLDRFIDNVTWINARHICTHDVLKISYDLVFYVFGKYFGHLIEPHNFPKSIDCAACIYFKSTEYEPFPQCTYRRPCSIYHKKCSRPGLRSFLRRLNIDCILSCYGDRKTYVIKALYGRSAWLCSDENLSNDVKYDPKFYSYYPQMVIADIAKYISSANRTINL